ncbi:hypothetical protein ACQR0Z_22870 [Bradyrhizobium sp. HKCCYLS3077]|uniref:hypothetical protein n=1 Tax=Bradyrhizobium sp. HKCCYLS3077 TaxID=3420761 RepID=UPI003EBA2E62
MSAYPEGVPVEVCDQFEAIALGLVDQGFVRYSADAILHRIRWHRQVEQGERAFKCNDHWTALLSRWFASCHPKAAGLFETRQRVAKAAPIHAYVD